MDEGSAPKELNKGGGGGPILARNQSREIEEVEVAKYPLINNTI